MATTTNTAYTATERVPGVYLTEELPAKPKPFETGIPAFLGYGDKRLGLGYQPTRLTRPRFEEGFLQDLDEGGLLSAALRGFFENGGDHCFVVRLEDKDLTKALPLGLAALASLDDIDLVSAPDAVEPKRLEDLRKLYGLDPAAAAVRLQRLILAHCAAQGDRFALLDPLPAATAEAVLSQRQALDSPDGALYYPWVRPWRGPGQAGGFDPGRSVPPSGYIAGLYARADRRAGVHRAPANVEVEGLIDLETRLRRADLAGLSPAGVNALVARRGRGIRVWGARTLSRDPLWAYVTVRRLVLTTARWIERHLTDTVFEPHDFFLWHRIRRQLTSYLLGLFEAGALRGAKPEEAFYVRCDAETNPAAVRDAGQVVAEIALRPAELVELIELRLVQSASGVHITHPGKAD